MLARTNKSLNNLTFNEGDILSIISNLDPNQAHGHDQISKLGHKFLAVLKVKVTCKHQSAHLLKITFKNNFFQIQKL